MKLVAYFSATGTTKSAAEKAATEIGADILKLRRKWHIQKKI